MGRNTQIVDWNNPIMNLAHTNRVDDHAYSDGMEAQMNVQKTKIEIKYFKKSCLVSLVYYLN